MSQSTPPDYSSSYEKYAFADPNLTETTYDSIKGLKERIFKDGIDLKIDSHKGFLRCEEPDCKFALKIRYGSSKGSVILGKSRYGHNHDPFKPKSFKKRKAEVLEKYYDTEMARDIKLKKLLEEIEKELGVPLTGDDLKKFKNKVYNIRQKIRREEEKKIASAEATPNPVIEKMTISKPPIQDIAPINPIPLPAQPQPQPQQQQELPPPVKKFKRSPIVKRIDADEIKKIIDESKITNSIGSFNNQIPLPQKPVQTPLPPLEPLPPLVSTTLAKNDKVQVVSHTISDESNNLFAQGELQKMKQSEPIIKQENDNKNEELDNNNNKNNNNNNDNTKKIQKDRESPSRFSLLIKRIF